MIRQTGGNWIHGSRTQRDKARLCTLKKLAGNLTLVIDQILARLRFADALRTYTSAKLGSDIRSQLDPSVEQKSQRLTKFDQPSLTIDSKIMSQQLLIPKINHNSHVHKLKQPIN